MRSRGAAAGWNPGEDAIVFRRLNVGENWPEQEWDQVDYQQRCVNLVGQPLPARGLAKPLTGAAS